MTPADRLRAWLSAAPPYVLGGQSLAGLDCSGAVNYVLGLPRKVTTATWMPYVTRTSPAAGRVAVYLCEWTPGVLHMGLAFGTASGWVGVEQGSKGPRRYSVARGTSGPWPTLHGFVPLS